MKIWGYDHQGRSQALPEPIRAKLEHDLYGASAFSCTVPVSGAVLDLARVRVYDGDTLLFHGPIDKQTLSSSDRGRLLTLLARDYSALLLDNEAKPTQYTFCRLSDLYKQLVERHGIANGVAVDPSYAPFAINKGYSEFEAIERFCRLTGVGRPYVDEHKTLRLRDLSSGGVVALGGAGQPLLSAQKIFNRHQPINEVVLMQRDTMQYSLRVMSNSGLAGEVTRRRYKKLFNYADPLARREAIRIMAESRAGSREYVVTLAGFKSIAIGSRAAVDFDGIAAGDLTVVKTALYLSEDGMTTTVTLWPRADVY